MDIVLKNRTGNNCKLVWVHAKHLSSKSSVYTHMQHIYWLIKKMRLWERNNVASYKCTYKKYHYQVTEFICKIKLIYQRNQYKI